MVVLGLVLIIGAVVVCVAAAASNTGSVDTNVWGVSIHDLTAGEAFAAGVVTAVIGLVGLAMVLAGSRHSTRMRRERRELARENARLTRRAEPAGTVTEPVTAAPDAPTAPVAPAATPAAGRSGHRFRDRIRGDADASGPGPARTGATDVGAGATGERTSTGLLRHRIRTRRRAGDREDETTSGTSS